MGCKIYFVWPTYIKAMWETLDETKRFFCTSHWSCLETCPAGVSEKSTRADISKQSAAD